MFERNKVDNSSSFSANQSVIAAMITLADGDILSGNFLIPASRTINECLNGESHFLEFQPLAGPKRFIAKRSIRSVTLADAAPTSALDSKRPQNGAFDPYMTLGVERDAEWEEIREAYVRLAKTYHADRFASLDMPVEVRDYMEQMSKRINAAYTLLEAPRLVKRKIEMRPAPVYVSRPRL